MKNLGRALRMSLKYRWSLAGATACSFLVALSWGGNIGAVLPFLDVIFKQQSLHKWVDERIARSEESAAAARAEIAALEAKLAQTDPSQARPIQREISRLSAASAAEQRKLEISRYYEPLIKKYLPDDPFQTLLYIVAFAIAGTFIRGLALMGNMVLVARVGQQTVLDLQNAFFRRTLQMELNAPGLPGTGDMIGRIRGETGSIGAAITTLYGKSFREPLKMLVCLAGAAWLNWRLLLFSMIVCPLAGLLMLALARSSKRANRRAFEESARLVNRLFQALTHVKVVKAFTMENHERLRFRAIAKEVNRKGMRIAVYQAMARMNNELLGISVSGLSFVAGGYLVLNGRTDFLGIQLCATPMSFAEMLTFMAFLVGMSDPLRKMGDVYAMLQTGMVAADRVFPLIDRKPAVTSPRHPKPIPRSNIEIKFSNIHFAYQPERPVLNGVSLTIPAGKCVAIVGPNGCGKSTLINLLPRFFDAQAGAVTLNGIDHREVRLKDLRRLIGYVTQQTMLFDDTIANNIRYGDPRASLDEVVRAARQAHAHSFIVANLDQGYESTIGEHGGKLSGGQRQRLALARAILRDPPIFILDEATSQIDPESEQLIHETLAEFIRGRTTLMVTHRLSTLELADAILMMDQGRVVDYGTHRELLERSPAYRTLRQTDMRAAA
jgi:ATP-binding cassette subfamily B protein/subfamily B ATP-binding cassette protein MsbA